MLRTTHAIVFATLLAGASEHVTGDRAQVGGRTDPQTQRPLHVDYPEAEHLRNKGGTDGAGLCVFASMDHAARWQNIPWLVGILERMRRYPGGGWPEKVRDVLRREYPGYENYKQAEGDRNGIPLMDWAARNRRMACVTYGFGERYGQRIAHMVNLVHLDPANVTDPRACILDNNFPRTFEWMSRDEFLRRWRMGGGGWVYVFFDAPPPPIPVNKF